MAKIYTESIFRASGKEWVVEKGDWENASKIEEKI